MLRSCYEVDMHFYRDDPTTMRVRWYFVDPSTPALPFAHPFGQRVWDEKEGLPQPELGEVYGTRSYYKGKKPYPFKGQGLCGSAPQWQLGASINDPLPDVWPGTPVALCCPKPDPTNFCACGPGFGFPDKALLTLTQVDGPASGLNGLKIETTWTGLGYGWRNPFLTDPTCMVNLANNGNVQCDSFGAWQFLPWALGFGCFWPGGSGVVNGLNPLDISGTSTLIRVALPISNFTWRLTGIYR